MDDKNNILEKFRKMANIYYSDFNAKKDRVFNLLGAEQNQSSGIYREALIKEVLREILPKSVSIDTGFIYGFELYNNSKQLDIVIWDSQKHSPVYANEYFVIVPPESVIAVITIKTNLDAGELESSLENLLSISELDFVYRYKYSQYEKYEKTYLPIHKFAIFYNTKMDRDKVIYKIRDFYNNVLNETPFLKEQLFNLLMNEKFEHFSKNTEDFARLFPRQIFSLDNNDICYYFGFGPTKTKDINPRNWGPCVYPQKNDITKPFEKFIYYLLQIVYLTLDTPGIPTLCAWGDINPSLGYRNMDISEIIEDNGISII